MQALDILLAFDYFFRRSIISCGMKVKEFIRHSIITISKDASFREALEVMVKNKTNGLVVVNEKQRVVGTIDSFNLIDEMVPEYLSADPTLAQLATDTVFHKALSDILSKPVGEMMENTEGICVHEDDSMIYAATLASKYNFRYIPVIDDDCDEVVGLISRTDIKRAMAALLSIEDKE